MVAKIPPRRASTPGLNRSNDETGTQEEPPRTPICVDLRFRQDCSRPLCQTKELFYRRCGLATTTAALHYPIRNRQERASLSPGRWLISARSIPGVEQLTAGHGHPCERRAMCAGCEPIGNASDTSTKISSRFPELFPKRNNDSHLSQAPWIAGVVNQWNSNVDFKVLVT
jgi:hypothetical protein